MGDMIFIKSIIEDLNIIIVTFNHRQYIEKFLSSLNKFTSNTIIVDNYSTDGTTDFIEKNYPEIVLIKNSNNKGYGASMNQGAKHSKKKYLIFMNPDIIVKNNFITDLITPLKENEKLITIPKVLLYDGSKINTCGNIIHFTGLAFTQGLGEDVDKHDKQKYVDGLSGVCFAIRKELFQELGGFDESIFLYMEDTELSWNINSRNLKILYVPSSIIHHDYELDVPSNKIYHLEMGRYTILKEYYTWKEYFLFAPSLIMTEIFTWGYSVLKGFNGVKYKIKAIKDVSKLNIQHKNCNRKNLINTFDWKIPEGQLSYTLIDKFIRKLGNILFYLNYNLIMFLWNFRNPNIAEIEKSEIKESVLKEIK